MTQPLMGTLDFVEYLRREHGVETTKSKIDSFIARGLVKRPQTVGTSRVWTEADVEAIRLVVQGKPKETPDADS